MCRDKQQAAPVDRCALCNGEIYSEYECCEDDIGRPYHPECKEALNKRDP